MTQEGFRRYLKTYIDAGIPFMAYWHPNGMGLIRLDEVEVPKKPPIEANVPAGENAHQSAQAGHPRPPNVGAQHGEAAEADMGPGDHRRV